MATAKFKLELEKEIVKSEIKRIKIFASVLGLGLFSNLFYFFFFDKNPEEFYLDKSSYLLLMGWFAFFVLYELVALIVLNKKRRSGSTLRYHVKAINVIDEVTVTSLLLFLLISKEQSIVFLDSPIIFLYFLIIIVSALHLDFKLSFLTGIIVTIQYTLIIYWSLSKYATEPQLDSLFQNIYYTRSFFYLFAGVSAGLVAMELRKRMISSFQFQNEKKEVETIFGQQVSPEIAKALLNNFSGSQKLMVTVMFLDIRNFSFFADKHNTQEVVEYQNAILSPFIDIVNNYEGIVNQILGDGFMATFGVPLANKKHCQNAVNASLEILEKMKSMIKQRLIPKTRIGIGLHTGEVIAGNIGSTS